MLVFLFGGDISGKTPLSVAKLCKANVIVHVHPSSGVVSGHLFSQFYEISFSL